MKFVATITIKKCLFFIDTGGRLTDIFSYSVKIWDVRDERNRTDVSPPWLGDWNCTEQSAIIRIEEERKGKRIEVSREK